MKNKIKQVIDSNIIIYVVDKESLYHKEAILALKQSLKNRCFLPDLCLIEFYQVITDPRKTPNPCSIEEAIEYMKHYLDTPEIEILQVDIYKVINFHKFEEEMNKYGIIRYGIYDYLIASCMRSNGVKQIITFNDKDFDKYEWVETVNPRKPKHKN